MVPFFTSFNLSTSCFREQSSLSSFLLASLSCSSFYMCKQTPALWRELQFLCLQLETMNSTIIRTQQQRRVQQRLDSPSWPVRLLSGLRPAALPRPPACPAGHPPETTGPLAPPPAHAAPVLPHHSWPAVPATPQRQFGFSAGRRLLWEC